MKNKEEPNICIHCISNANNHYDKDVSKIDSKELIMTKHKMVAISVN
jgi:hypothetical protein